MHTLYLIHTIYLKYIFINNTNKGKVPLFEMNDA